MLKNYKKHEQESSKFGQKERLMKRKRILKKVSFRSWPLKVKGKPTREEIYDHL
jgi:hypothetical protein